MVYIDCCGVYIALPAGCTLLYHPITSCKDLAQLAWYSAQDAAPETMLGMQETRARAEVREQDLNNKVTELQASVDELQEQASSSAAQVTALLETLEVQRGGVHEAQKKVAESEVS